MMRSAILVAALVLSIPALGQPSCDGGSTFCGANLPGVIAAGTCLTGCQEASQTHSFSVFGNSALVTFTATSEDFTPAIEVENADGTLVDRKAGRGTGPTRLGVVLPPGVHRVRVIATPAGASGAYTLRLGCLIADAEVFCAPDDTTLCLYNRFQVRATLRAGDSEPVSGTPARGGDRHGSFSAPALTGADDNPEIFVKVLDGRAINGRWWVFVGGLTGFDYEVTVRDTMYKRQRTYTKADVAAGDGVDLVTFFER